MTEIALERPTSAGDQIKRLFGRLFKPEYTALAAKFVGGMVTGAVAGYACTMNEGEMGAVPSISDMFLMSPSLVPLGVEKAIDSILRSELANSANPISPETMRILSVVAAYSGSAVGSTLMLMTTGTHHFYSVVGCATNAALGLTGVLTWRSMSKSNGPPSLDM